MDKQLLISFIANNDKLELLKARVNRFNPLKVLKVQDYEIRHSNVLAWIFNPAENHNFDDRFLKRFLLKVMLKPDNDDVLENMDVIYDLQQISLMDFKVSREEKNIDILLVSEQQKIVVLIENKVFSGEHSNQLMRYYQGVKSEYPGYLLLPILLTLNGELPTQNNYFSASYDDVLETIEFIMGHYKDRTSSEVIAFLEYYSAILKEKYAMDINLQKLCKEIYAENKEVIDLLYSVGNQIDIEPAVPIFSKKYPDIIPATVKNRAFWFGVDSFVKGRSNDTNQWGGGFPVCFWFSEYYGKLKLTLEVGPFSDPNKRINFLNLLESHGIKVSQRAKEPGRSYTRLHTRTTPINDWTDYDEIAEAMEELYEREEIAKITEKVAKAINSFDW